MLYSFCTTIALKLIRKLKPRQALKRTIRASFNRDSSFELDESKHVDESSTKADDNEEQQRNDSSIRFGCSINTTNSWMFSDAARL